MRQRQPDGRPRISAPIPGDIHYDLARRLIGCRNGLRRISPRRHLLAVRGISRAGLRFLQCAKLTCSMVWGRHCQIGNERPVRRTDEWANFTTDAAPSFSHQNMIDPGRCASPNVRPAKSKPCRRECIRKPAEIALIGLAIPGQVEVPGDEDGVSTRLGHGRRRGRLLAADPCVRFDQRQPVWMQVQCRVQSVVRGYQVQGNEADAACRRVDFELGRVAPAEPAPAKNLL
jgi:hypothetical protein